MSEASLQKNPVHVYRDSTIILHGLPPSIFIGIDLLSLTSAPRFQGLSHIPSGPHFLYSAATTALSIRHGLWLFALPSSLCVFRWDSTIESLQPAPELVEIYRAKLADGKSLLHQGLFPYSQPQSGSRDDKPTFTVGVGEFARLTSRVTEQLVDRIIKTEMKQHEEAFREISSTSCATNDREHIPGLTAEEVEGVVGEHSDLRFTNINLKQTWRTGAVGRERTDAARDRSWALEQAIRLLEGDGQREGHSENLSNESNNSSQHEIQTEIDSNESSKRSDEKRLVRNEKNTNASWGNDFLGEMQFVFLMILTLSNYSCLEQWKRMLALVLTSRASIQRHEDFFANFLSLLRLQLLHGNDVEDGLFDTTDGGGDYLLMLLKTFKRNLEEQSVEKIQEEFDELEAWLKREWNWDLNDEYLRKGIVELEDGEQVELEMEYMLGEDERGEYAPAVVDRV